MPPPITIARRGAMTPRPNTGPAPRRKRGPVLQRRGVRVLALVLVFVAVHVPLLGDYTWHHADEYLYTDAVVRMREAGDLTTPRYADGSLRFNKPLLTYWAVAASFATFGVGLAASRLPFLLAAALLAWVTWRTALLWLRDARAALLAVAILLAHPETAELATRATPDMLLCLFTTICLYGVARLLLLDAPRPGAARLAWAGAGLAVATKGLPGLLPLLYGAATLVAGGRLRRLLSPPAVAIGALLAIAGMATAFARHGTDALLGLWADQVGERALGTSLAGIAGNLGMQVATLLVELLPWTAFVLAGWGRSLDAARGRARLVGFALGWTGVLLVLSALPEFTRPRYLAPGTPLLAIACAGVLADVTRRTAILERAARALLIGVAVAAAVVAVAGLRIGPVWVVAGAMLAIVASIAARRTTDGVAALTGLAVVAMLGPGLLDAFVRPTVLESPAPALASCLAARGERGLPAATVGEVNTIPADLRLASGGRLDVTMVPDIPRLKSGGRTYATLLAPGGVAGRLEALGHRLEPCGREVRGLAPGDWWTLLRTGDLEAVRAARERRFFLAVPTASP
jgi:4-amino-4-deoxy-L-arabinose transferase-like glycosyltransferase